MSQYIVVLTGAHRSQSEIAWIVDYELNTFMLIELYANFTKRGTNVVSSATVSCSERLDASRYIPHPISRAHIFRTAPEALVQCRLKCKLSVE